jgi:hypothetical protein
MWYIWIISSGLISIISVCILYILNKDNYEKQVDYRNTFITLMIVSLIIMSLGNVNSEQIVPNITNMSNIKVNNKVPF